jgi:AIR synthase-related protein
MSALDELADRLRRQSGLLGKRDIQAPAAAFPHQPFPALGPAAALGDDAALLPSQAGGLLLACEGMAPALVEEDPWFAGWSAVLVNLSDIAAMGGRPLAVVNSLWCRDAQRAEPLLAGMGEASARFGVPVVGGHTNLQSPYDALSVAVLGVAEGPVLSARSALPGDTCVLLVNTAGRFHRHYPFWDAATSAEPERLRRQLALLPQLAGEGLAHGAKDISMGGLAGTAVMFAEAAGCTLRLDLEAIAPPASVELEAWLTCFPSFGYLLAVRPERLAALQRLCAPWPELLCARIGGFHAGPPALELQHGGEVGALWQEHEPLTGFAALPA